MDPDDLEEGFPGRAALAKAGYTKRSDIDKMTVEELDAIDGIGLTTAEQIVEAL